LESLKSPERAELPYQNRAGLIQPDNFGHSLGRAIMKILDILMFLDKPGRKQSAGQIRVKLKDINQLFNSMDPSPFTEKDLDEDAEAFIESWAFEYPISSPISLHIITEQALSPDKGAKFISDAIHNFYKYKAHLKMREFKLLMREGRVGFLIGIFFLFMCFVASEILVKIEHKTVVDFLREGFLIVGWVSMWKPIQIYLYEWWPLLRKARIYIKLSNMKISIN
jgi:hypothetical protein